MCIPVRVGLLNAPCYSSLGTVLHYVCFSTVNHVYLTQLSAVSFCILYRKVPQKVVSTWFTEEKHSVIVACGDETQQELIPFKHKERWVVELVLLKLTVTEIDGVGRQDARATKTARRTRLQ